MSEQIRGRTVVQKLTPAEHASVVAVVESDDTPRVVRVARPDDHSQAAWAARARAVRGLEHPALVKVVGANNANPNTGEPAFVASEYIVGPTLAEFAQVPGVLTEEDCGRIVSLLAEGLKALHERGIAHGRVHTGQVRLRSDGTPVLLDVGATWGEADPDQDDDIEALITLAQDLPETPRLSALLSLRGTGASADDVLTVLSGAPSPSDLVDGAFDDDDDLPVLTAPSVPSAPEVEEDEQDAPAFELAAPPLPQDLEDAPELDAVDTSAQDGQHHAVTEVPHDEVGVEDALTHDAALDTYGSAPTPASTDSVPSAASAASPEEDQDASADPTYVDLDEVELIAPLEPPSAPTPPSPDEGGATLAGHGSHQQGTAEAADVQDEVGLVAPPTSPEPVDDHVEDGLAHQAHVDIAAPSLPDSTSSEGEQPPASHTTPAPTPAHYEAVRERQNIDHTLVAAPKAGETPADVAAELAAAVAAREALSRQVSESVAREQRSSADLALARAEAAAAVQRAEAAEITCRDLEHRIAGLEAQLEAARQEHTDLVSQVATTSTAQLHVAAVEAAVEASQEQIRRLDEALSAARGDVARAEAEVEVYRQRLAVAEDQVNQDAVRIVELTRALEGAVQGEDQSAQWDAERAALIERAEVAEGQVRTLTEHLDQLREQASPQPAPAAVVEQASAEVEALRAENESLRTRNEGLNRLTLELLRGCRDELGRGITQVAVLRTQVETLTAQLGAARDEVESLRAEVAAQVATPVSAASAPEVTETPHVLPATPAPAKPTTVAVVDSTTGPAGPALMQALRDAQARNSGGGQQTTPPTPGDV